MAEYDVIVVGGRCAGSATAIELRQRGYDVLVVDRARFPSDTLSTHYIQQRGASKLAEWGVLERLERAGAPRIASFRWVVDDIIIEGVPPPAPHAESSIAPRRTLLDAELVDVARENGAEVREGFLVEHLRWRDDRVVGIAGRDENGNHVEIEAELVVGADGRYSRLAEEVGAKTIREWPILTCSYYSYWDGVDLDRAEVHATDGVGMAITPTDGGLVIAGMSRPIDRFEEIRDDVPGSFERDLQRLPAVEALLEGGERVAPFRGTGDLPNYIREAWGPGWALVGDAVHHKDPLVAQGISDAFDEAGNLAAAIDAWLRGERSLEAAMTEYAESLLEVVPMVELTMELGQLEIDDEARTLFTALGSTQKNADRFIGTIAGTVPVAEFWDESHLRRLVLRSMAIRMGRHMKKTVRSLTP